MRFLTATAIEIQRRGNVAVITSRDEQECRTWFANLSLSAEKKSPDVAENAESPHREADFSVPHLSVPPKPFLQKDVGQKDGRNDRAECLLGTTWQFPKTSRHETLTTARTLFRTRRAERFTIPVVAIRMAGL